MRWATEPLVDFAIGLLAAIITVITFVGILWTIGGSLRLGSGEGAITIPAYLVLCAILYGVAISGLTLLVGRKLPLRYARRNESEARFRFGLMRLRDSADAIAMGGGQQAERRALAETYDTLAQRWLGVIRERVKLTWITNGNGVLDQLERPQSTKTCTQEPCELVVSVGGGVNRGRAGGIDCAVGVAPDVLMFGSRVGRLQWTLQAPADSRTEFRFRPQAAGGGVVVYANTQGRYFSVAQATPDRVVLARGQRVQEAYAYGIYLEWKPKDHPKDEWQACTPLDPIIIEHN